MITLTHETAAAELDVCQYREEISLEMRKRLKEAGLVAVFGASDDLVEFDGAWYDEAGASDVQVDKNGPISYECDQHDECPHEVRIRNSAATIKVNCEPDGVVGDPMFTYSMEWPYSTFRVMEDDELYCIGAVFSVADITPPNNA